MNIGVNCRVLLSHRMEGVCRYIYETTRQMVLDHPHDQFYFFFDRPFDDQFIFAANVTPVVIGPQARHPILWYLWFEHAIPRALRAYAIDVFYSGDTYLSLKTDVLTLLICHDVAYKHYPEHIRYSHRKYYDYYFPRFHHRADHIVAVSEFTRQDIIHQYQLPADKVTVGHNATPPGFRVLSPAEKQAVRDRYAGGSPYFLFVGSLHPRKNLVRLIIAFEEFKKSTKTDMKLLLVGRLAWKNTEMSETYQQLSYKDDIIMTGSMHEDISEIIGATAGLYYVSLFEGFGIPILEGFSAQVPVVTSTVSSMPEVAGDCAILVDPTNVAAIADTMRTLESGAVTEAVLQQAKERAATFTWQKTADHIYRKLSELVDR